MFIAYIVLAVVMSLAVLLAIKIRNNQSRHRQFVHAVNDALRRSFQEQPIPKLTVGSPYGFPDFRLEFPSRANHQEAADSGAVSRFMVAVQDLCKDRGTKDNPFDARKALYCTDPEHQRAIERWATEEREKLKKAHGPSGDA